MAIDDKDVPTQEKIWAHSALRAAYQEVYVYTRLSLVIPPPNPTGYVDVSQRRLPTFRATTNSSIGPPREKPEIR